MMKNFAKLFGLKGDAPVSAVEEAAFEERGQEIIQVCAADIMANPFQPRKMFSDESLDELAESIREYGVIQPLLVRKNTGGYELIAGERRLRASRLAGLVNVPVIVKDYDDKKVAELAMIENLQREDLHFLEEAQGLQLLLNQFGLTQEELARHIGKNQSTIANKLRLLKLSETVRNTLIQDNLTERHARALLKIDAEKTQLEVLEAVRNDGLNVRETEKLIDEIATGISREIPVKGKRNIIKVIKDVRIFINTIHKVTGDMKKMGLKVKMEQEQDDNYVTIHLRIPKHPLPAKKSGR